MDWLTFIVSMTKALTWPSVAVLAIMLFRHQFVVLLGKFGRRKLTLKGGGAEVSISEELDKIESAQPVSTTKTTEGPPQDSPIPKAVIELASSGFPLPPAYIISQAWLRVIDELQLLLGEPSGQKSAPHRTLAKARELKILSDDEVSQLHELRHLRNEVVHIQDAEVSLTDALRFNDLATSLIARFREKRLITP